MTSVTTIVKPDLRVLEDDDWFHNIPPHLHDRILRDGVVRKYPAGSLIYSAGDPPGGIFGVLSGEVRLVNYSSQGKFVYYTIVGPGHWFGILSDLDGMPRFSDARVGPDSMIFSLSHFAVKRLLSEEREAPSAFLLLVCHATSDGAQRGRRQARGLAASSDHPEALAVCMSNPRMAGSPAGATYVTQEALAAMVDLSRQTVSKVLRGLQAEGLIDLRYGQVRPTDIPRLQVALEAASTESLHMRV